MWKLLFLVIFFQLVSCSATYSDADVYTGHDEVTPITLDPNFWKGQSRSHILDWQPSGLYVKLTANGMEARNVFRQMAEAGLKNLHSGENPLVCSNAGECTFERRFRLLSVFRDYITFEESVSIHLEPNQKQKFRPRTRLSTIDLNKLRGTFYDEAGYFETSRISASPFLRIDDIFDSEDVVLALFHDDDFRSSLEAYGIKPFVGMDVSQLIQKLPGKHGDCPLIRKDTFAFCADAFSSFEIVDVFQDLAYVEIVIRSESPYVREPLKIRLELPLTPNVAEPGGAGSSFIRLPDEEFANSRSTISISF